MKRWLVLGLLLMVLWSWALPGQAFIRTFDEVPGQVLVPSRHTLEDDAGWAWQVVLFARRQQLQLRLLGFPERYHLRHPDPLRLGFHLGGGR